MLFVSGRLFPLKLKRYFPFGILLLLICTRHPVYSTNITINSSTFWSTISSGTGLNGLPSANDSITITNSSVTLTVDISSATVKRLALTPGSTGSATLLLISGSQLTISGELKCGGSSTGQNGNIDMTSGGKLIFVSSAIINFGTATGIFTGGSGTVEFQGTMNTGGNGYFATFNDLIINGGNVTLGQNTTFNNLNINSGTLNLNGKTHTITGDITSNGTLSSTSSTVILSGSDAQNLSGTGLTFNIFTISNTSGEIAVNNNLSASGTLTINSNCTLHPASNVVISGSGALGGFGKIIVTKSSGNTDFTSSGAVGQYTIGRTLSNLTVEFAGTGNQDIGTLSNVNSVLITNTSGIVSSSSGFSSITNFTVNAGAVFKPCSTCNVAATNVSGTGKVYVTKTSGTDHYNSQYVATNRNVENVEYIGGSQSYTNLPSTFTNVIVSNNTTLTVNTTNAMIINGTLTVNSGSTISPAGTISQIRGPSTGNNAIITGGGTLKVLNTTGDAFTTQYKFHTYELSNITVDLIGSTAQTISVNPSFGHLKLSNTSGVSSSISFSVDSAFEVSSGVTFTPANTNIISGNGFITGSGTIKVNRSGSFSSQYSMTGSHELSALTVNFNGSGGQDIDILGNYGSVIISNSSGTVTGSASISIGNSFNVNSSAIYMPGAAVIISGAGTLTGSGKIYISRSANTADFSTQYSLGKTLTNLTLEFNGSADQEVTNAISSTGVIISNTGGTVSFTQNVTVSGTFTVNASGRVYPLSTVTITGNSITGSGTIVITKSAASNDLTTQYSFTTRSLSNMEAEFAGGSLQASSFSPLRSLTVNNSYDVRLDGSVSISSTLTLKKGMLKNGSGNITISSGGSIIVTEGSIQSAPILSGTVNITYNGTADVTTGVEMPAGTSALNNLAIAVTPGKAVTLNSSTTLNGTLTLTSGVLSLANYNLTMGATGVMGAGNSNSYVRTIGSGRLIATISAGNSKTFPVGYNPYLPISIQSPSTSVYTVGVTNGVYFASGQPITDHIVGYSWDVKPGTGVSAPSITLQWPQSAEAGSFNRNSAYISYLDNAVSSSQSWTPIATATGVSGGDPYTLTQTMTGVTLGSGSTYRFAVGDNVSALPVKFTKFNVRKVEGNTAIVEWTTASEINNRVFEIERSTDGQVWNKIDEVAGAGTSNIENNYSRTTSLAGITSDYAYYRIKQVDYNGSYTYSPVRSLSLGDVVSNIAEMYPNPAKETVTIQLKGIKTDETAVLTISDLSGKVLMNQSYKVSKGESIMPVNISGLCNGNYIVKINLNFGSIRMRLLKI